MTGPWLGRLGEHYVSDSRSRGDYLDLGSMFALVGSQPSPHLGVVLALPSRQHGLLNPADNPSSSFRLSVECLVRRQAVS